MLKCLLQGRSNQRINDTGSADLSLFRALGAEDLKPFSSEGFILHDPPPPPPIGKVEPGYRLGADCGSPVVKVSDYGKHVMSSRPVPQKTRRVGQRCTLNLSRAQTSSHWCGVVVWREGWQLRCRPRHLTIIQNYVVRHQKP
ncbi:uncharacterized protein TNCV_4459971 [Trichonephila clavipes]|nr:uncharacterized protein TNCV_4459971 [Trichonephila clavipes]